jgi:ADP-heptose:LPS heptosyltransferase
MNVNAESDPVILAQKLALVQTLDDSQALAISDRLADLADDPDETRSKKACAAIFSQVVEVWNDRFEPAGRQRYQRYFGRIVHRACLRQPTLSAVLQEDGLADEKAFLARASAVAQTGAVVSAPKRILVPSRVTVGADVLLTSVLLQHLRQTWPQAQIILAGDAKLAGLFGGMDNLEIVPVSYQRRGPLSERLAAWLPLRQMVIDRQIEAVFNPDSRLDQLGLLPLGRQASYHLWQTLEPDPAHPKSLSEHLDSWCQTVLASASVTGGPIAPRLFFDEKTKAIAARLHPALTATPTLAVKLDFGGNDLKGLPQEREVQILKEAQAKGWRLLLDRGFGAEELARNEVLTQALGLPFADVDLDAPGTQIPNTPLIRATASIAAWAAALSGCHKALAYDSAGHHLAAALDIPLVTIFTGHPHKNFPIAWQPRGRGQIDLVIIPTEERAKTQHVQTVLDRLGTPI